MGRKLKILLIISSITSEGLKNEKINLLWKDYQMTMELDSRLEIRMCILKDSILEKSFRIRPNAQNSLILAMLSFTIDE